MRVAREADQVYGDPATFASKLRQRSRSGADLEGRLAGVRRGLADYRLPTKPVGLLEAARLYSVQNPVEAIEKSVRTWCQGNARLKRQYLPDRPQPTRGEAIAIEDENWDLHGRLDDCARYIKEDLADNAALLDQLQRSSASMGPAEDRFAELRQSGLIEASVLHPLLQRIRKVDRRRDVAASLGASKELVEATLRAVSVRLGNDAAPGDDMNRLGKTVRASLTERERSAGLLSPDLGEAITRLQSTLATIELGLATLRNTAGTGHGRPALHKHAARRHALFAADLAEAHTRYILLTLSDLKLI